MTLSILGCQITWNEVHQNGVLFSDNFWPVLPQNSRSRKTIPALGELLLPSLLHRVDNFFHTCHSPQIGLGKLTSSTPALGESVPKVPLGELSSGVEQYLGSISKRQPSFSDTPRQSIKIWIMSPEHHKIGHYFKAVFTKFWPSHYFTWASGLFIKRKMSINPISKPTSL